MTDERNDAAAPASEGAAAGEKAQAAAQAAAAEQAAASEGAAPALQPAGGPGSERPRRAARAELVERAEPADRVERAERAERGERPHRAARAGAEKAAAAGEAAEDVRARPRRSRAEGADGKAAAARPAAAAPASRVAPPKPRPADPQQSRRVFLRTAMWASTGLFLLQGAVASLAMFWPRKVVGFGSKIDVGPLESFAMNSITRVREGKFYLSRLEDGIIALYWRCTHLGCTVPWNEAEGLFHCPCHGSMYERTGQNVAGPAPRPLDYMEIEIVNGRVVVNTGSIHQRARHDPSHVTPV